MSAAVLSRVASVLLLLYAAGPQLGFRRVDPALLLFSAIPAWQL